MVQQISISDVRTTELILGGVFMWATNAFTWEIIPGVIPYQTELFCSHEEAERLYQQGKVDLVLRPDNQENATTFKHLWVLEHRQHPSLPHIASVLITDHRWLWHYKMHVGNYNDRRNGLSYFRVDKPELPVELEPVEETAQFLKQSLNPATNEPWRTFDVIQEVFNQLIRWLKRAGIDDISFRYSLSFKDLPGVVFDDFDPKASFADTINQLLYKLPQAAVSVDYKGNIWLIDRTSGNEELVVGTLGTPFQGGMLTRKVASKWLTPRKVNVYFRRLVELKPVYTEESFGNQTEPIQNDPNGLILQNILFCPDEEITVNERQFDGTRVRRKVLRGEPVELLSYLEAISRGAGFNIDLNFLTKAEVPWGDWYSKLFLAGQRVNDGPWKDRVAAIGQAFRRIYRINRVWADTFEDIYPYRVGVINAPFGQHALGNVYSDHFYISGDRAFYRSFTENRARVWASEDNAQNRITIGSNVLGFVDPITPKTKAAPALLDVLHKHQGILKTDWVLSPVRPYEKVVPGLLRNHPGIPMPGLDCPVTMDAVKNKNEIPQLESGYKCAMIFSVIPIAPANINQLHKVTITPNQVQDKISTHAYQNALQAEGPELDLFIDRLEYARIIWSEKAPLELYRQIFGIGLEQPIENLEQTLLDNNLVLNQTNNPNIGQAAALDRIAQAAAASVWAAHVPHYIGAQTGRFHPELNPMGWTDKIVHTVHESGFVTTTGIFPERLEKLNIRAFMDPYTNSLIDRAVIRRGV